MNETTERKLQNTQKAERSLLEGFVYYLSIILKYRKPILIATISVMLASGLFCALSLILPPGKSPLPNIYAAEATILIQPSNQADLAQSILEGLGYEQASNASLGTDNADLVLEILQSRKIIDQIISEFDMASRYKVSDHVKGKTRSIVLQKAAFKYSRATGSLKISYEDIDPVFSQKVVNRMVTLLSEWFDANRGQAKKKKLQTLTEKLEEVKADIAMKQERLKELQKKYGVLTAQDLGASQATSLANLRSQLILKEIEIKNYSSFTKIDDPQFAQLKDERQTLLDLIEQTQSGMEEPSQTASRKVSLPDVAQEFSQLTIELDVQQKIYNTLSPLYEASKLMPESTPVFQVLELAEVPDIKERPQRMKILVAATLAGFAISVVAALAYNLIVKVKNDPEKRRYFE